MKKIIVLIVWFIVYSTGCTQTPNLLQPSMNETLVSSNPSSTPIATKIPTYTATLTTTPTAAETLIPISTPTPFGGFTGEYVVVQKYRDMDLFLYTVEGKEISNLTASLGWKKLFMGWSPEGKSILVGVYDAMRLSSFTKMKIFLVDIESGDYRELIESNGLTSYDWSPDGKKIQLECYNGRICLIDTHTYEVRQTLFIGNSINFSPDGRLLGWDNFPPKVRLRGNLLRERSAAHGSLYILEVGEISPVRVLTYQSYLGASGTHWAQDSQSLYILDIVDGQSALSQVFLDSKEVRHLYQFDRDICATDLSTDGRFFLVMARAGNKDNSLCNSALGVVNLDSYELTWFEELENLRAILWSRNGDALVVYPENDQGVMIDFVTGTIIITDFLSWTKPFEAWWIQTTQ